MALPPSPLAVPMPELASIPGVRLGAAAAGIRYANRTDLIRTALRTHLAGHAEVVREVVARKLLVLGIHHFDAQALRAVKASGQRLQIRVLGLATIAADVTPALALASIESLTVLGALHASPAVKAALAERIR